MPHLHRWRPTSRCATTGIDSRRSARSKGEIASMKIKQCCTLILLLAGLAVLPFRGGMEVAAASPVPQTGGQATANQKTVQMRIAGMTCAACAKGLEASFRHMAGVAKVSVDYKAGQAVITFDPAKQSSQSLAKFVTSCGYQVKETKAI